MALLNNTFVTDEEDDAGFKLIPAGSIVTLMIKESEIKPTRAGDGEYIKIVAEVMDEGEFNGNKVWHNFNIVNPNEKAVQIGRGQLKRLNQILGISELQDTAELHGQPFRALIKIQKGQDGYDDQNTIGKFLPLEGAEGTEGGDTPWD